MPVIKSAIKKLRRDRKKETHNNEWRRAFQQAVRTAEKAPNDKNRDSAFSLIDKAAKHNLIHKNKAARLKAQLTKLAASTKPKTTSAVKSTKKKSPTKASTKKAPATQ